MGSQKKPPSTEKIVSVKTSDLRQRLNALYARMRGNAAQRQFGDSGRFDYLWDLKELALMKGSQSVDVPESWLEELEKSMPAHQGH